MGEKLINPIHNVHKKYRRMNLVNPYVFATAPAITYNTYIGGVSGTISTASALATKLAIPVSNISNFTVVGSDIKCKITGSYVIPVSAFYLTGNGITYYKDNGGLVTSIGAQSFRFEIMTELYFPYCVSVGNASFQISGSPIIYIPRCTSLGITVGNDSVFDGSPHTSKVYVPTFLQTVNSGSPDGDLTNVLSNGGTARYVTDFTAPNFITNLAAGNVYNTAIQLNFTVPSSANAIDYYELYINGVFNKNITASGGYIIGLTASTSYTFTLIAVDIFYNKSVVSNSVTQSTTSSFWDISTGLISYYKLDEITGAIANDSYRNQYLTNTSITVNQTGKIGTSYLSTANLQKLETTTATNITGNFTINTWIYRTASPSSTLGGIIQQGDYNLSSGFGLWLWADNSLSWRINQTFRNVAGTLVIPLNTWKMLTFTYNGSNVKIYIDGVLEITTTHTTNPNSATRRTLFYNYNNNASFLGRQDEASIYNMALTQTEIDLLYNSGTGITL